MDRDNAGTTAAQDCARQTLDTISTLGLDPYPWLYEMWFTYHSGSNPDLNDAIKNTETLNLKSCLNLYTTHIGEKNSALQALTSSFNEQKKDLEAAANIDPLSGLANRRQKGSYIQNASTEKSYAVIMMDLDHFKSVNDQYGHKLGDDVIKSFGEMIRAEIKGKDLAARIGGEEFLIILEDCHTDEALKIAEKIRGTLAKHEFKTPGGESFRTTASAGIAQAAEGKPSTIDTAIAQADEELYRAKAAGRDQVFIGDKKDIAAPSQPKAPSGLSR